MKRVISIFLTVVLLLTLLPAGAMSSAFTAFADTEEGYTYTVSDNEATITDVDAAVSGEVAIPETLGGASVTAIAANAFADMPTEAVVLMLSLAKQDAITYARFNFPMHVAHCDHGTYLATTPQAMPEDAGDYHLLPVRSSGYIYQDHFECYPFPAKIATIAPLTPARRAKIYEIICRKLEEGEQTVSTLAAAIRPAFEGYDCGQVGASIYQVLDELSREGKLKCKRRYMPGQLEGLFAPEDYMWL